VKVGDMVKVKKCSDIIDFFCYHNSSCIGLVIDTADDNLPWRWIVQFDCGEWELSSAECEVISESR